MLDKDKEARAVEYFTRQVDKACAKFCEKYSIQYGDVSGQANLMFKLNAVVISLKNIISDQPDLIKKNIVKAVIDSLEKII